MSAIDNRIVSMTFNNRQFASGAEQTMGLLGKLKESLKLGKGGEGIDAASKAADRFGNGGGSGMLSSLKSITGEFSLMKTVGITALATLTSRAVSSGASMAKGLALGSIKDGFAEYETNMGSIQTILANTKSSGGNLESVNKALAELNSYSDKTIYNFSQMASNIGTFTAAGVKLEPATQAIKGIANLAAISGSTSEQASNAMYQLSQAMAAGKVTAQDWISVNNAGMGGKIFQDALYDTAKAMGKVITTGSGKNKVSMTIDEWTKSGRTFKEAMSTGVITADVLQTTLGGISGDMTDAELAAKGFSKAQIKSMQDLGKLGLASATEVKTITQMFGTYKEALGSGWSRSFQTIIGGFEDAKKTLTGFSTMLTGTALRSADSRNKMLDDWAALGGRQKLIDGLMAAFKMLGVVFGRMKSAFREVFPPKTGRQLLEMTTNFSKFMKALMPSEHTLVKLEQIFQGVAAVLSIAIQLFKRGAAFVMSFFKSFGGGNGTITKFLAEMANVVIRFDTALKRGTPLLKIFQNMFPAVAPLIQLFRDFGAAIGNMWAKLTKNVDLSKTFGKMPKDTAIFQDFLKSFEGSLGKFGDRVRPVMQKISDGIKKGFNTILESFGDVDWKTGIQGASAGLGAALILSFKKIMKGGLSLNLGNLDLGAVGDSLKGFTNHLKLMQADLKADILMKIAIAIGVLAASLTVLAMIPAKRLSGAMGAVALAMATLLGAMITLTKVSTVMGTLKLPVLAAGLILIGGAVLIMSTSMLLLSRIDPKKMSTGMMGLAAMLTVLAASVKAFNAGSLKLPIVAAGLMGIAIAVALLLASVKGFSTLSWDEMKKGLLGVAAMLAMIGVFLRALPTPLGPTIFQLLGVGQAISQLGQAVGVFGKMSMVELGKGLLGIAAAMATLAIGLKTMPKDLGPQSLSLIAVAQAMNMMYGAVSKMGTLGWDVIIKGLVGIAGALGVMIVALRLMQGGLVGAAALMVVALALNVFIPALVALEAIGLVGLAAGLGAVFVVFGALALVAKAIGPWVPVILSMNLALLAFGLAIGAAGLGASLFATAFAAFVAVGTGGAVVIVKMIQTILTIIPEFVTAITQALLGMAKAILAAAPGLVRQFGLVLAQLLKELIKLIPLAGQAISKLIDELVRILVRHTPQVATAALGLMVVLLGKIGEAMPQIVAKGVDIIIKLLEGFGQALPRLVQAAFDLVIKFIESLALAFDTNASRIGESVGKLAVAVVKGLWDALWAGLTAIWDGLGQWGRNVLTGIWNGIGAAISWLWDKAGSVGLYIIQGVWNGLGNAFEWLWGKISGFFGDIWDRVLDWFGIGSPSKLFAWAGDMMMWGLGNGIEDNTNKPISAMDAMTDNVATALQTGIDKIPSEFDKSINITPTITPVLDMTDVAKNAGQLDNMLAAKNVTLKSAVNTGNAQQASNDPGVAPLATEPAVQNLTFNQTNNSPKELSVAEVYRNTRSQLTIVKKGLA